MDAVTDEETEAPGEVEPDESAPVEPEPDEEEAETVEEPAPVEEPAEPAGLSEAEIEKIGKKLDGEATRHANRLSEIMGDSAQALMPCELCDPQTAGFHLPVEVLQPESDLDVRLLEVLKTPAGPTLKEDPYTRTCETCGGNGKTLTRGHVPGHETRGCQTCKGTGYIAFDEHGSQVENLAMTNGDVIVTDDSPLEQGENDIWGSPRLLDNGFENPNYGKMPQYKHPQYP